MMRAGPLLSLQRKPDGFPASSTLHLSSLNSPEFTPDEIRERMRGNIYRCRAYPGIVCAIQATETYPGKNLPSKALVRLQPDGRVLVASRGRKSGPAWIRS
jgi:hypothetical protein